MFLSLLMKPRMKDRAGRTSGLDAEEWYRISCFPGGLGGLFIFKGTWEARNPVTTETDRRLRKSRLSLTSQMPEGIRFVKTFVLYSFQGEAFSQVLI